MAYNGWKNYETWNVKLWIDNDPGDYQFWREQTQQAWKDAKGDSSTARHILADALKEYISDYAPTDVSGLYRDLLFAALEEVDWYEIADAMLNDEELEGYEAA